jgi:polysaccharide export outer membrane protein
MTEVLMRIYSWRFAGLITLLLTILVTPTTLLSQISLNERSGEANENYRIGPGDVLDVIVSKNETLSRSGLRVSNQGTIQLAMFDHDVPAACLTERQLADSIKERYRKYLVDPYVNVSVREYNSSPVAIIGAVNSPGRFQLQRQIRLVELLTFVNGPSANAGKTVEIMRTSTS